MIRRMIVIATLLLGLLSIATSIPLVQEVQAQAGTLCVPTEGTITQRFSSAHPAIDISANAAGNLSKGKPVYACATGTVVYKGVAETGGSVHHAVAIKHDEQINGAYILSFYAHMGSDTQSYVTVNVGDRVGRGDLIGYQGDAGNTSGVHLHWEIHTFASPFLDRYSSWGVHCNRSDLWYEFGGGGGCGANPNPARAMNPETYTGALASPIKVTCAATPIPQPDGIIVKDKDDANVERGGNPAGLFDAPAGSIVSNNHATWTYSNNRSVENYVKWKPPLDKCGRWEVYAYIAFVKNEKADATGARYTIKHRNGTTSAGIEEERVVNLDAVNQGFGQSSDRWLSLGTYLWSAGANSAGEYVFLGDTTGAIGQSVIFDDMRWMYRGADDAACNPATPTPPVPPSSSTTPLIFIPGVMGSRLREVGEGEIWPGNPLVNHNKLSLDPDYLREHPYLKLMATDVIRSQLGVDIYQSLITKLTTDGGYIEYTGDTDPDRRKPGCAKTSVGPKPTLFVFPYDWRLDNTENAHTLADYVSCIREFYPDSKVDIITHSMGGLVARSYMLQHPGTINKLITIAAPWLGAPKAIQVLETGQYFDLKMQAATGIRNAQLKVLAQYFSGVHQLLPSAAYFNLGATPFGEAGWDINGDGQQTANYTPDQLRTFLDTQFNSAKPGSNNQQFHSVPGQDDWRNDTTGTTFYHFYGVSQRENTIDRVVAVQKVRCVLKLCLPPDRYMDASILSRGDETVPARSAARMKNPFSPPLFELGLNAPGATRVPIYEKALQSGPSVEHTSLVQHPDVLAGVLQALRGQVHLSTTEQDSPPATEDAYYLRVTGPISVTLSDAMGQTTNTVSGTLTTLIPDVTYHGLSDNAHLFVLPMNEPITMTLQSNGEPLEIELTEGTSMTTTQAIRYQDVSLPISSTSVLKLTPQGIEDLRYDADGDGTFESVMQPSAAVSGPQANDTEPPTLSITRTGALDASTVTITAADTEAGVQAVYYSLDGTTYQQYTEPITVNAMQTPTIYAFADDNIANRSSLVTYQLARRVNLPLIQGRE